MLGDNEGNVKVEFLTGAAGTGKTFEIKRRIAEDPHYGLLTSTTGVSAINLNTTTVHSKLGFYDTESLQDAYSSGKLHRRLRWIADDGVASVVIDETSMFHAKQLDLVYNAIRECNAGSDAQRSTNLGLVLTGDFCQLPPVKGEWAFKAECWPEFAAHTTRLSKIWRQADPGFIEGINLARRGKGDEAAARFKELGTQFALGLDMNFDGTTIVAKNMEVDRYNNIRMMSIREKHIILQNTRWGIQTGDWKNIPQQLIVKPTALVMLLANTRGEDGEFLYANGDLARVIEYSKTAEILSDETGVAVNYDAVAVQLMRTGEEHFVPQLTRQNLSKQAPTDSMIAQAKAQGGKEPYYEEERKRWVLGEVTYWPMRLGYASTVHKSQGLSLDCVQIDCRDGFFGTHNLAYVALSRARSIQGMRIVGLPETLAKRINIDPEVEEWL